MNRNVDICYSHSKHEDREGKKGCDACEDGQGNGDHEQEGHYQPVHGIEDGHGNDGGLVGGWMDGWTDWDAKRRW